MFGEWSTVAIVSVLNEFLKGRREERGQMLSNQARLTGEVPSRPPAEVPSEESQHSRCPLR